MRGAGAYAVAVSGNGPARLSCLTGLMRLMRALGAPTRNEGVVQNSMSSSSISSFSSLAAAIHSRISGIAMMVLI